MFFFFLFSSLPFKIPFATIVDIAQHATAPPRAKPKRSVSFLFLFPFAKKFQSFDFGDAPPTACGGERRIGGFGSGRVFIVRVFAVRRRKSF